ncbi:MAG: sensory box histidine kinase, partial [Acidobacteria bacterium]|nr:sensory box histidine kinase [Acidobacteriota bacterium]
MNAASGITLAGIPLSGAMPPVPAGPMPPVAPDPYRSIFESSLDAILLIDPADARVLHANPAAMRLYANAGLVGSSMLDVSFDEAKTRERIELLMRDGALRFESVQRMADGRNVHVEINATVAEFEGRRVILSINRDVTDRKEIEIQQREAAEFGRRAVLAQDVDALFTDSCETVLAVLGSDTAAFFRHDAARQRFVLVALAGEPMPGAESAPDRPDYLGGFTFAGSRPVAFDDLRTETRFTSPVLTNAGIRSGIVAPVRGRTVAVGGVIAVSHLPRRFTEREIAFVQTIANAVAEAVERIQAESALHEREARLQLIVSRLPVIIWSTDERMRLTSIAGAGFAAIAEDWVRELDLELDQLLGIPRETEARAIDALSGTPVVYDVSDGSRELRVHVEPLRDAQGSMIGTVGIAFDRTSQNRTERVLSQIAQGVVSEIGEHFFPGAVGSLAGALHADCVFIAERIGERGELLRTVADSRGGEAGAPRTYRIAGTPCEQVLLEGFCWYERGVRRAFPDDPLLRELQAESYAGVPILASDGEAIGVVAMMNRRSFPRDAAAEAALRIYADRASAELDRTRRERSLVDAKNYVENLIDSANVLIIENDVEGRVRLVNRAFETLTGRSRADVVDTLLFDLFADGLDGWRRDAEDRRAELNEGRPVPLGEQATESSVVASDGAVRILRLRSNDVWRDGEVVGTIFFGVDVTDSMVAAAEQDRLQEQVLRAAAEWRATFDSVVTPMIIVDADGVMTRVNRVATQLADRTFHQIIGTSIDTLSGEEPWTTAAALVRRMLSSGLRAAVEEARDSDGRTWNLSTVPLGAPEGAASVIVVLSDISGIVALQESLRASERMSAMGQLVAGVAHEVRNPLFGISAALDAFEAEFGRSPEFAEYVERLRSDADRLRRLMNDLLEYGRPAELLLRRQSFATVIERSIRVCETETRAKGVNVRLQVAPLLPEVTIDHDRMVQVLKNVIENATAFTASGSVVAIDVREEGGWIVCSIADQGPGFRPDDITHVFDPFFTRRRGGTGLGLAIV